MNTIEMHEDAKKRRTGSVTRICAGYRRIGKGNLAENLLNSFEVWWYNVILLWNSIF
jgi:hypothetical protein